MDTNKVAGIVKEYTLITVSTVVTIAGVYFFKFQNNFSFGGVTGVAVIVSALTPITTSQVNLIMNILLLVVGFLFLGRSFGIKTVYVSLLTSVGLSVMEIIFPMQYPLTNQPLLELIFAVFLPGVGAAMLFNMGASSGGTDIIAMILKKYTHYNIGTALFIVDLSIALAAFPVFGATTGLFSMLGLLAKSLVIDTVIESINLCKYFTVICENPEPICKYIIQDLNRSATICRAEGAFTHKEKAVIITAMRRSQSIQLRNFIKATEPTAFILISNTSEIIGKGFLTN